MSTLINQAYAKRQAGRRPLYLLLFALVVLVVVIVARMATDAVTADRVVPPPVPIELASQESITRLEERLRRNPADSATAAELGLAYLQKVRETADPALYMQAQTALDQALQTEPKQLDALVGQGMLALARHDFAPALAWAEQARTINPFRAQILGIMVDAQVELGRYEAAVATLQKMVDLRPDLSSYSRISYMRELYGDVDGAIKAMSAATNTALPGSEQWLWTQVQLGNLYFNRGDLTNAEAIYQKAWAVRPDYAYAQAGIARVQAAQGNLSDAITTYAAIVQRLPLPEMVITLGEWYAADGNQKAAQQQFDLVNVIQQLNTGVGMDVDLELALFNANHGDPALAEQQARAVYERRPTIYAADTLAWALYQNGKAAEAQPLIEQAMRLGTRDALLYFHAGLIANALGDKPAAQEHLQQALTINPHFSVRYAPEAKAHLDTLVESAAP